MKAATRATTLTRSFAWMRPMYSLDWVIGLRIAGTTPTAGACAGPCCASAGATAPAAKTNNVAKMPAKNGAKRTLSILAFHPPCRMVSQRDGFGSIHGVIKQDKDSEAQ